MQANKPLLYEKICCQANCGPSVQDLSTEALVLYQLLRRQPSGQIEE
jgi:hypothetical protein